MAELTAGQTLTGVVILAIVLALVIWVAWGWIVTLVAFGVVLMAPDEE